MDNEHICSHWHAAYVRSRFEQKVFSEICRRKIEAFLPLVESVRIWSDRKKLLRVPLFPGYVFVKVGAIERSRVLTVDGFVRFVGVRNRPSLISEEEIEWVRIMIGEPTSIHAQEPFVAGEYVEVVAGPFRGIRGVVQKMLGTTRVVVTLEAISRAVSFEIQPELLKVVRKQSAYKAIAM